MTKFTSKLSVAPMMDWTDRHCRYLHRLFTKHTLLYSEMVTTGAVLHGDRERLLGFDKAEHPVALQLGGCAPDDLAASVRIAEEFGYDEVNLNVGCPSDRVQSGRIGAVLMKEADLVAECAAAMISAAQHAEITVKCRIGVDDQDPRVVLPDFLQKIAAAGVKTVAIHARKAWLDGLSPKENREIPPLDYDLVFAMKAAFSDLNIVINGGISGLDQAGALLARGIDGVMIGRAAYHAPTATLAAVDPLIFNTGAEVCPHQVVHQMLPYIDAHLTAGGRLHHITRHMLGIFQGQPGARGWRRVLSEQSHQDNAGPEVVLQALARVARPDSTALAV